MQVIKGFKKYQITSVFEYFFHSHFMVDITNKRPKIPIINFGRNYFGRGTEISKM